MGDSSIRQQTHKVKIFSEEKVTALEQLNCRASETSQGGNDCGQGRSATLPAKLFTKARSWLAVTQSGVTLYANLVLMLTCQIHERLASDLLPLWA